MSDLKLSKDKQDTGYGERSFKWVGNPDTGAALVEFPAGAAGSSDALEATQLLVKTAVEAINTKTGEVQATPTANTILGRLKDLLTGLVLAAGENFIGSVGGILIHVSAELTRPADTTAYTAGDVVSNNATTTTPVQLANIFRVAGGSGYIRKLKISTDKKSITPRFRLHFFNASTITVSADNAPFKEVYADTSKRLGYYDMPAMTTAVDTTNSDMSRTLDIDVSMEVNAAAGSRDLFVVYEALDAFTPASGQKFMLSVALDNN